MLYAILGLLYFGHVDLLGPGHMVGEGWADQISQIWFLEWAYYALVHGLNPLYSHWQNVPVGVNLAVNTSAVGLGLLFAPVTAHFGPVVTWNLLLHLALILSAFSMCLVLRRWVDWWPAAFVGGLLYGFSVYQVVWGNGYLFLVFVPLPPLFFLLLHEALVRQTWPAARTGVLIGVVCGLQYLISSEILASMVLMGAVACVVYLVSERKVIGPKWSYLKRVGVFGAVVGGALLLVPLAFTFAGPQHLVGVPNSPEALAPLHGDLLGLVVPGTVERVATSSMRTFGNQYLVSSRSLYVGIPFLVMVGATVVLLWKRRLVRMAGLMTAVALILSLGATLYIGGSDTHIPLPFAILAHLPLADGFLSTRFSLYTVLFGSALVALGLDALRHRIRRSGPIDRWPSWWAAAATSGLTLVVAALVVVPTLPSRTEPIAATAQSAFFGSADGGGRIPVKSVVLSYPYPGAPINYLYDPKIQAINQPLLDQAMDGMRFQLLGGYGWHPSDSGNTIGPAPLKPHSVQALFGYSFYGYPTDGRQLQILIHSNLVSDLREFLVRYRVGTVVVFPLGSHPSAVVSRLTAVLGTPSKVDGATAWFNVGRILRVR